MDKLDKKIFGTLFFSIFAAVTGVGIVVPLLPVYANDLGASGIYIGFIFGAFSLTRTIFLPVFGRLSDKKGRKPFIVIGLGAYALISIAFIFATDIKLLISARCLQGIASAMLMPVIQAYIGDISPHNREGVTMGLFNMSMFLGLSMGPLIGGYVKDLFSLQASFICMGLLACVGFCLSVFLLPATRTERAFSNPPTPVPWRSLLLDAGAVGLFAFRFGYVFCVGVIWGFMPVLADTQFSLSSSAIGFMVMLGVMVSGILHPPMGYLADRWNKTAMVVVGGGIVAAALVYLAVAVNFRNMIAATVLFGIGGGVSMPAIMAMAVLKGNRLDAMGSIMGFMTAAHSMGMLMGSLIAGMMMDFFQLRLAFHLGAVIMVFCTAIFYLSVYMERN